MSVATPEQQKAAGAEDEELLQRKRILTQNNRFKAIAHWYTDSPLCQCVLQ